MATNNRIIDITRSFEWEVSKEQFQSHCASVGDTTNVQALVSPVFYVKIESQVTNWSLGFTTNFYGAEAGHALVFLYLHQEDVSLKAEVEDIVLITETGYRPLQPCKLGKSKMVSTIEHFNGRSNHSERFCFTDAGLIKDLLNDFNKNKVTVVATVRFYMDRNEYIKKTEREQNFLTHLRSTSDFDSLADFTVICGGRHFKCHRLILASRSTVFKAMILNDHFVENRENCVTVENASPGMVEAMLEFISNGMIPRDIEEKAIDLIVLANRYDLQDLMEICEISLVNNLTVESVIDTLIAIDLHVPNSQHRKVILDFIKTEAAQLVKSSDWKKFVVKYPDLITEIFLWAAQSSTAEPSN